MGDQPIGGGAPTERLGVARSGRTAGQDVPAAKIAA